MDALILDTETTGFDNAEVIELAWKAHDAEAFSERFEQRYQPEGQIQWGAMAVHHILPGDLIGKPPSRQALADVPKAPYWIGHGIDFDWGVLGKPPVKRICTLAMARALWPEVDSHTLSAMTYFTTAEKGVARQRLQAAHRAHADVDLCADLLKCICVVAKLDPFDLERLYAFSEDARIPKIMTFGKYKGQPVGDVDRGWFNWYRRQADTDPYLLEAFRRLGY